MIRWVLLGTVLAGLLGCRDSPGNASPPAGVLRLAVTTSTRDSGLLDALVPWFEKDHGVRVDVIAVGTGAALKLGAAGDVDVVFVHDREAEDAFMAAHHGVRREDVMYNTFLLVGPNSDPAGIRDLPPEVALTKIAGTGAPFVSRGDNSGTHQRELQLWKLAGGRPEWAAYMQSGQGMGATVTIANELGAYLLIDSGTYLAFKGKIALVPLGAPTETLRNPYGLIVVNPEEFPQVNAESGHAFADFMISPAVQKSIGEYRLHGEPLFFPLASGR